MDITPTEAGAAEPESPEVLLRELEEADPAEAPDIADRIAATLVEELEATQGEETT